MIGYLTGTILDADHEKCIVMTGGVGYEVFCPMRPAQPTGLDQEKSFFIHTHVREDALTLYGFETQQEKSLFEQLIKVSGVGAKTALVVLSTFPAPDLVRIITAKDAKTLTTVKGIGKKAAEKIILELADRLQKTMSATSFAHATPISPDQELLSALVNLGYKEATVAQALSTIDFDASLSFDQRFKLTLQRLSQNA